MWRCGKGSTDTCLENPEHFIEVLHCERFHKDITGPWAMIADGMADHSKCGAVAVIFFSALNPIGQLIDLFIFFKYC